MLLPICNDVYHILFMFCKNLMPY